MSVTHTTKQEDATNEARCSRCHSVLPPQAMFCGACGERVQKSQLHIPSTPSTSKEGGDISGRYRITSLVRRQNQVQLFLAVDTMYNRPVVIRDIDIDALDSEAQAQAVEVAQQEYDLLRRQRIPDVMPAIDLRCSPGHIFVASGWPFPIKDEENDQTKLRTATLRDLLQSGVGLPGEQIALHWLYRLCNAVGRLHRHNIILGDLDSSTIVVSDNTYNALPALMVSWLPLPIRNTLLASTSSTMSGNQFSAPEARSGNVDPRADIYSLGALLYLLLTGSMPAEPSPWMQRPWRNLRELNPRVSPSTEAVVMRALSVDPANRFQRMVEMAEGLLVSIEMLSGTKRVSPISTAAKSKNGRRNTASQKESEPVSEPIDDAEEVTISIVPFQTQLATWELARIQSKRTGNTGSQDSQTSIAEIAETPTIDIEPLQDMAALAANGTSLSATDEDYAREDEPLPELMPRQSLGANTGELPLMARFKERLSGILPALPGVTQPRLASSTIPSQASADASLLKRLQHFLLGEQKRSTTAAALIETPLRVQPNQGYTLRIHIMGRDAAASPPASKKGTQAVGLSALVHNEVVHIEVRSAIYQNYAYIVQRADILIPGQGYAAEVTIPMQPLSEGPSGRHERLHIFFMDEMRRPLYEKPFAVEVFVSHLVQSGREGHNVLTIPF